MKQSHLYNGNVMKQSHLYNGNVMKQSHLYNGNVMKQSHLYNGNVMKQSHLYSGNVMKQSYIYNGNSFTGNKMASLYWNSPQVVTTGTTKLILHCHGNSFVGRVPVDFMLFQSLKAMIEYLDSSAACGHQVTWLITSTLLWLTVDP